MQILFTKLSIPALRSRLVKRGGLIQKLDRGADCGFVLVSAPAGYGKTTLLSGWLKSLKQPVAWISLDEGDNDPVRFLTYLFSALRKIEPSVGEVLEISLQPSLQLEAEIALTPLVNKLDRIEQPFWLVLDDYHLIQNHLVHQYVSFLLDHRPAGLHLAIATRADPPLPLSRLRVRSQMVELRLSDLRFSTQETAEFLNKVMNLDLKEADVAFLETSTEGWIAGLQMAGLSLQGREDAASFIRSFSGENRYILDFLFEEVFRKQPVYIQDFLLQTSFLAQMCGFLCEAVTGREDSQETLEMLEKSNLFLISLDEQRKWYRYHHLFGDLLKNRYKHNFPGGNRLLNQRASAWFEQEHDLENAIVHAIAALDFERAADLIERIFQTLDRHNKQSMLTSWIDHLPREILERRPWLCVSRAWGYYWMGRRDMEEEWLQAAENSIEKLFRDGDPEKRHIQGHIAAVRSLVALTGEDIPRVLEMGQKSLDLLPEGDEMRCEPAIALGGAYWALGDVKRSEESFGASRAAALKVSNTLAVPSTCYMGIQQVKQGRLQDALSTFRQGLRLATLPDGTETPVAGFANVKLGGVMLERNDLDSASHYLNRGVEQCVLLGQPDVLTDAYACLGRYQLAIGDLERTHETIQKADQVSQRAKVDAFVLCWLDEVRLKAWLAENNLEAAILWAQKSGLNLFEPFNYLHDLHHQNLARVLVTQGIVTGSKDVQEQAAALLARLQTAAEKAGWLQEQIKFLLMQAVNDHWRGKPEAALQSLTRALLLAEPGRYVLFFLEEGEIARGLLVGLANILRNGQSINGEKSGITLQEEQISCLRKYISMLLSAFEGFSKKKQQKDTYPTHSGQVDFGPAGYQTLSSLIVEQLSGRELEVLKLLAQGCSDKKIAESLVIARGTVHKHLKNIYSKLDVHSRSEAIVRARDSGLL